MSAIPQLVSAPLNPIYSARAELYRICDNMTLVTTERFLSGLSNIPT